MSSLRGRLCAAIVCAVIVASCGSASDADDTVPPTGGSGSPTVDSVPVDGGTVDGEQQYPDVVRAQATRVGDTWTFAATISSPYDTPERYADAWRVVAPDGTVLGVRELAHDHAAEQPFTRSLPDVDVPDGITVVTVEGRDSSNGWGGGTVDVDLSEL